MMENYFTQLEGNVYKYKAGLLYQYSHFKRDGYSIQFSKDASGNCRAITRTPSVYTSEQKWYTDLVKYVPNNTVLMGELFVDGGESTDVRSVLCENPTLEGIFEVYACPLLKGEDLRAAKLPDVADAVNNFAKFIPFKLGLTSKIPEGYEGFVLKTNHWPRFPYDWMKLKTKYTCDLRVIGFNMAEPGKFSGLVGSVICASDDGKINVAVSGMSDEVRKHMTTYQNWWIGKIIEIEYTKKLRTGGLRHPEYKRHRDDKNTTSEW